MRYSAAIPSAVNAQLLKHLLREDRQEDLCFALWYPSSGNRRKSALITEPILPKNGERFVHGNAGFGPAYFERALGLAMKNGAGLAFIHSHLGPGWQDMSKDDIYAELRISAATLSATSLPLVGLTLGTDNSWSARFWLKESARQYERKWCESVRVVGDRVDVTYNENFLPPIEIQKSQIRTVSVWGEKKQQDLARLRIGVIGVGSVGTIVAETLARVGVQKVKLIDFDVIEEVNLDRLLHANSSNVGKFKANIIADAIKLSATAPDFKVQPIIYSVTEEAGFKEALDCDILFSCVDRPWPRAVLNLIAYSHLIPVIDGGIRAVTKANGDFKGADWKAHVVMPSRRCLLCMQQYNPADVQLEREGYLDDPKYIESLPQDHLLRQKQNVFSFALDTAALEILQMLSIIIKPLSVTNFGEYNYHFASGQLDITEGAECKKGCPYVGIVAMGDTAGFKVTGNHKIAESIRLSKQNHRFTNKITIILKNILLKVKR